MTLRRAIIIIAVIAGCAVMGYLAYSHFAPRQAEPPQAPVKASGPQPPSQRLFHGKQEPRRRKVEETAVPEELPAPDTPPERAGVDEGLRKILEEEDKKRDAAKKLMRENPEAGRKAFMEYKKSRLKRLEEYERKRAAERKGPPPPPPPASAPPKAPPRVMPPPGALQGKTPEKAPETGAGGAPQTP